MVAMKTLTYQATTFSGTRVPHVQARSLRAEHGNHTYTIQCYGHARLRVFLARRTRVTRIPVSTPKIFQASDCGRLGRQAADHPWSALRVVKSCQKGCPTAKVLLEAKAAALHPEPY